MRSLGDLESLACRGVHASQISSPEEGAFENEDVPSDEAPN